MSSSNAAGTCPLAKTGSFIKCPIPTLSSSALSPMFFAARSSAVPMYTSSRLKPAILLCIPARTHAPEQIPVASRNRQIRRRINTNGFDKKARGKADATSCHEIDPRFVVITAPSRPVLKKFCTPSETPKTFSSSPITILRVVTRATTKKHE